MQEESHSIQIQNHGHGRMTVYDPWHGTTDIAEEDLSTYLQQFNDDRFSISISHAGPLMEGSEYPADVHVLIRR